MWIITPVLSLMCLVTICSAGGAITLSDLKLGDDCSTTEHGQVTKCEVKRGDEVDFSVDFDINGGESHNGISTLHLTLKWTGGEESVTEAPACLGASGSLVINGIKTKECAVRSIAEGAYSLVPYKIKVPDPDYPGAKTLSILSNVTWSDGSRDKNYLIGAISVTLK